MSTETRADNTRALERYYRFHARIYDATRWSFLFGRKALVKRLAAVGDPKRVGHILEVGCGTGANLLHLGKRFPNAHLTGLDLSAAMLDRARHRTRGLQGRIRLLHRPYDTPVAGEPSFDLIVFSYSLSMMNPGWEQALDNARRDLASQGLLGVVDFADTKSKAFARWMGINHVNLGGHLHPALTQLGLGTVVDEHHSAYGTWRYLLFIGRRP